jgi:hypothetical protein
VGKRCQDVTGHIGKGPFFRVNLATSALVATPDAELGQSVAQSVNEDGAGNAVGRNSLEHEVQVISELLQLRSASEGVHEDRNGADSQEVEEHGIGLSTVVILEEQAGHIGERQDSQWEHEIGSPGSLVVKVVSTESDQSGPHDGLELDEINQEVGSPVSTQLHTADHLEQLEAVSALNNQVGNNVASDQRVNDSGGVNDSESRESVLREAGDLSHGQWSLADLEVEVLVF